MPSEVYINIQLVFSRAFELLEKVLTFDNLLSWLLLAFTAVIAFDDMDTYAGVKSICEETKEPEEVKIELANTLLTTKGHKDSHVWKRYLAILFGALIVILLEEFYLKKSGINISTAVSVFAVAVAVITKRICNKKFDKLERLVAEGISKTQQESSNQNGFESRTVKQEEVSINERADAIFADTVINEYLDVVRGEYEIERNKKQSFENRAGLILALVGAMCIFVFEQINLKTIFLLIDEPLTFTTLLRIISGVGVYIGFALTFVNVVRTINVKQHDNFEVKSIDEELLGQPRTVAIVQIIFTYRDIVAQHRVMNEKRAKTFRYSLYGIVVALIAIVVYITFT